VIEGLPALFADKTDAENYVNEMNEWGYNFYIVEGIVQDTKEKNNG
jgi:hypothetical protein